MRLLALVALLFGLGAAPAAQAQMRPKAKAQILNQKQKDKQQKQEKQQNQCDAIERFLAMPPEQRQRQLANAVPERRERIRQGLEALESLSGDERQLLCRRFAVFSAFPAARREALRMELRILRRLALREIRRRLESNEIRNSFSQDEIRFLRQVVVQDQ